MTSVFAARRAAEEFADLVDGTRPDVADRYAALSPVVALLADQPRVQARPAFVADLRSALMAAADLELAPAPARALRVVQTTEVRRTPVRQRRFSAAAAVALVVVGGTTGVAAAAQSALPGDGLYSVKRGIESATSVFATTDAGKGSDLLDRAGTRIDEVEALSASGAGREQIRATLEDFSESAGKGAGLLFRSYEAKGQSTDIAAVRAFAADQRTALAGLADLAPAAARQDFDAAMAALDAIDTEALSLCAGCGGSSADAAFDDVDALSALDTLLSLPARSKTREVGKRQETNHASAPAGGTTSAPPTNGPAPTGGGTTGPAPTGGTTSTPTPTPEPTQVVQNTLEAVTEPVTSLVNQLGANTGLTAVTNPLTNLLGGLTGK